MNFLKWVRYLIFPFAIIGFVFFVAHLKASLLDIYHATDPRIVALDGASVLLVVFTALLARTAAVSSRIQRNVQETQQAFNAWMKKQRSPDPVIVQGSLRFITRTPYRVHINLEISNPGETPIYFQGVDIMECALKSFLKPGLFQLDAKEHQIPPGDMRSLPLGGRELREPATQHKEQLAKRIEDLIKLDANDHIALMEYYVSGGTITQQPVKNIRIHWKRVEGQDYQYEGRINSLPQDVL